MADKKRVCKDCSALTTAKECPLCGSKNLADKYKGTIVIFDSDNSEVAKRLNIEKNGAYALKH